MYFSDWKEEECGAYWESLVSLEVGLPPIIRARAVKDIDGFYSPVIRCFMSGKMLDSGVKFIKNKNPIVIEHELIHYVYNYLKVHANPMIF